MKRVAFLGGVLAAVSALALWQYRGAIPLDFHREVAVAPQPAPSTTVPGAPAEQHAEARADQQVEQVGESADSATPLQEILPRQSIGQALGLHATKDPLKLRSGAAVVMDVATQKVDYAKNEETVLPMASITKLMTAVVLMDADLPMDAPITITEDDMDKERHSRSRMKVGTVLTRREALHLALMSSENRAAHALGRTYPGGLEKFVEAMNRKARQLGMAHTTYVDPTGLATANQSTARDLATLVMAASKYPLLREFSTDPEYLTSIGNRKLRYLNSNRLVRNAGWDMDLQKTGYIVEAGHCVVMQAKLAGRQKVLVLLDADSNNRRNADAERIRSWAYQQAGVPDERRLAKAAPKPAKVEAKAVKAKANVDKEDTKVAARAKPEKDDGKSAKAKEPEKDGKRQHKTFDAPADHKVAAKKKDSDG